MPFKIDHHHYHQLQVRRRCSIKSFDDLVSAMPTFDTGLMALLCLLGLVVRTNTGK